MTCIFCDIIAGRRGASMVYRDDRVAAFMDIQPVNKGHVLVVPLAHAAGLVDISKEDAEAVFVAGQRIANGLRRSGLRCDGVTLHLADGVAANQEVFHLHLHVIPRFAGDGFGLKFPPTYANKPGRPELDQAATAIRDALETAPNQGSLRAAIVPCMPYPELPSILRELVAGVEKELAANLVGVYLVGSLATGDFDLDSDVDFLVVTKGELSNEAVRSLQAMHARIHSLGCYPAQHLEGSYISLALLNRLEAVGVQSLWYLDNGSTTLERSVHDNQWHVRWILRERGVRLIGPDPKTLLEPVPVEAMRAETATAMRRVADEFAAEIDLPLTFWTSRFGQSFAVLNACRMLHTFQAGAIQSKLAGVKWARHALEPAWGGLIERAWHEREGVRHCIKIRERADAHALKETLEFLRYAVRKCER